MVSAYAKKLGLRIQKMDVGAQKINRYALKTYEMVIAGFQVGDKLGKARFFQKTFLLADICVEVIFKMSFLTLSKVKINFVKKKLT